MAEVINATTKHRHEVIFDVYTQVISELGVEASNVSKKSMYEKVAKRTGYSCERVRKVITMNFKRNGRHKR